MGFWTLIRPVRSLLVTGIALQVLAALAGLVPMVAAVQLISVLVATGEAAEAWLWLSLALIGVAARLALGGAGLTLTHVADAKLGRSLRLRLAAQLSRMPLGDVARRSSGRVKKLITDDVGALHSLIAHAGGDMAVAAVTAGGALLLLFGYSWQLALLALIPVVAFVVIFGTLMGTASAQLGEYQDAKERVNAATVEFARGIAVVKTFGRTGRASAQYRAAVDDYADFFGAWMGPMIGVSALALAVVSVPSVVGVMTVGGLLMLGAGWIDANGLVAGLVFGIGLAVPLTQLESYGVRLRTARDAATRIGEFLAIPALPVPAVPQKARGEGGAGMKEVSFRYASDAPNALTGVELELAPGTVTGLVGGSGAGKSTLAALLPRFWDATEGTVEVAGVDVRRMDPGELYRRVAFVFQGARLVPMSIEDNIRINRPQATRSEVISAAVAANIHERIMAAPRGYDAVPGVDASFSGGEVQRVTLARVLLDDAPVIVLDEPTSFADPENEVLLQRAIGAAVEGRAALIIAHRLRTISAADRIVVLADGRAIEQGDHGSLIAQNGAYAQMWRAQSAGEEGMR